MHAQKEMFICDHPKCRLFLERPIALLCGCTICEKHVQEVREKNDNEIKCESCDILHKIPDDGFCLNKKLMQMIEQNFHLTDKQKEVKEFINKIATDLFEFEKSDLNHPDLRVHEYFSDIRNNIDLHREQMIESINKKSDELIEKANKYENECKSNIEKLSKIDTTTLKNKIDNCQSMLRNPIINEIQLMNLNDEIKESIKIFEDDKRNFVTNLFLNRQIDFEAFDNQIFGRLNVKTSAIVLHSNGRYEGEFLNGKRHGKGSYYWTSGHKYVGEWFENNQHGFGVYYYDNGARYEGEYCKNMRHGKGVWFYSNGTKKEGVWKDDKFVE